MRNMMRNGKAAAAVLVLVFASGCSTVVADNELQALEVTQYRAKFDLECEDVDASVVSQQRVGGGGASEHTIDVTGCGRELTYLTSCSDAGDCKAVEKKGQTLEFKPRMEP